MFCVVRIESRVSGFGVAGFRFSGFELYASSRFESSVSGFELRVSDLGFLVARFEFRVSVDDLQTTLTLANPES